MIVKLEDVCERGSSNLKQSDVKGKIGGYPVYGASGHIGNADFYQQENTYIAVVKDGAGIGRTMLLPEKSSVIGTMQYLLPKNNILPKYLYYAVRHMKLEKYFSGATIPHIYFKDYKNEKFNLAAPKQQAEIVNMLEKVEKMMEAHKQQLQKLDELVKARFIEMFGNISKFKIEPLNSNVEEMFIGPFGSALKNECFVDKGASYCMVYEQKHAIQKTMNVPTRYVDKRKYNELKRFSVHGGDIIVSCRGTIGEIYALPEDAPLGIMHPSIMKIRLKREKYCNQFFVYMLEQYMRDSIIKAKGSGVKMAVTATELGKELFVVPKIEEQIAFEQVVNQTNRIKLAVQNSLDKAQLLFDSLMQKYFE